MSGPSLGELELLVAVADTGSLGLGARRLAISQPAASQRLRTLETSLGVALLDRGPTGSELTAGGVLIVEFARSVLAARDRLTSAAEALREGSAATLRLAASLTTAEFLLPQWLIALRRRYPTVRIGLAMGNSAATLQAVRRGEADLGFIETVGALPAELQERTVASDRLVLVVSPEHPWAALRRPVSAAELAATSLVMRESGSGTRETLAQVLADAGPLAPPALEVASTMAVKTAALSGLAPAVLSTLALRAELSCGSLVEVALADVDLRRPLRAVWRRDHPMPASAQRLLELFERDAQADACPDATV
jgi:DNA-binding transcriptional LysR family regulator